MSQDNRIVRRMETRSAVRAAGFRCWENARRRVSPTGGDDGRRQELERQLRELLAELKYLGVTAEELGTLIKEAYGT